MNIFSRLIWISCGPSDIWLGMDSPSGFTIYLDVPSPTSDVRVGNKKLHLQDVSMCVCVYVGVGWSMRLWFASDPCGSWSSMQLFSQPIHASKCLSIEASALRFCRRTTCSESYIHSLVLTPARPPRVSFGALHRG